LPCLNVDIDFLHADITSPAVQLRAQWNETAFLRETKELFHKLDIKHNGYLDVHEVFQYMLTERYPVEHGVDRRRKDMICLEAEDIFQALDTDRDGRASLADLRRYLKEYYEKLVQTV